MNASKPTRRRIPQDRERRTRFLARMHRAAGRLSASGLDVAEALERLLGQDGRLDPSHGAAGNPHLRQEDAELIIAAIFDQITATLARGARVELRGFGAFTVKQRPARIGRNPRTGKVVAVKEKTMPFFRTGTEMLRRLNGGSRPASEHLP